MGKSCVDFPLLLLLPPLILLPFQEPRPHLLHFPAEGAHFILAAPDNIMAVVAHIDIGDPCLNGGKGLLDFRIQKNFPYNAKAGKDIKVQAIIIKPAQRPQQHALPASYLSESPCLQQAEGFRAGCFLLAFYKDLYPCKADIPRNPVHGSYPQHAHAEIPYQRPGQGLFLQEFPKLF